MEKELRYQVELKNMTQLSGAGRNRRHTHRPELTIFWEFYFIVGEQNVEEEEGRYMKIKINKQKDWKEQDSGRRDSCQNNGKN